tara:strand:+ start:4081 stop:4374 length:294 start_codon:yes stop_codon:yes gene_type:complete
MTRAALASAAKVSPTTLTLLEQGRAQPNLATLESVARVLGVRVADLFDEEQAARKPTSGSTTFFRLVGRLRGRTDSQLRALEKLLSAFDRAVEAAED